MSLAQQQDYFRPPAYGNPGFSTPMQLNNQFYFNNRQTLDQSGNMSWATVNFSERLEVLGSYMNRPQMPNSFQNNRDIDPAWSYYSGNRGPPASLQMPVTPQACTTPRPVGSQVPRSFHGMPALGQAQGIPFPAAQPVFHPVNASVHQPGQSHEQLGLGYNAEKEPPSYMQFPHQGYSQGQAHQVPFPGVRTGSGLGNMSQFGFHSEKNSHCDPTFSYSDPGKSFSSQHPTCHQAVTPFRHRQTSVQNWTSEKYQVAKTSQQNVHPTQPVGNLTYMQYQQQSSFSASVHAGHQGRHNAGHQIPVSVYTGGSSEIYGHASIHSHLESREPLEATTERPNSRSVSCEKIKTCGMAKNTSERLTLQTTNADSLDRCMTAQGPSGHADHCHSSNSCPPPSSMPSVRDENTMEKAGNSSLPSVQTDINELEKDVDAGRSVQHSSLSETQRMDRNSRCSSESLVGRYAQLVSKTGVQLKALKSPLSEMLQERTQMFFQKRIVHLLKASKDDSLSSISRSGVGTDHGHDGFVPPRTEPSKNACQCRRNPTLCYLHDALRSAAMQTGKEKGLPAVESRKVTTKKGQSDSSLTNHSSEEDIAWGLLEKDVDVMKHTYSSTQQKWNIRGQRESAGFQQSHESSLSFKANAQVDDLGRQKSDVHCKDATFDGSVGCYQEAFSSSTELISRSDTADEENESDIFDLKCMVCLKTFSSRDEVHCHLSVHLQDKEANLGEKGDVFVRNTEVEQEQPVRSTLAQADNGPLRAASLQSADEEMAPDEVPKQNSAPVEVPEKNSACEKCVPAHTGSYHFDLENEEGARLCESRLSPLWDQKDAVVAQAELDKDESFKCNYSDQFLSNPPKAVISDAFLGKQSCNEGNEDLDQHTDLMKQNSSSPQEYRESKYDETAQSRNSPVILRHSVKRSWNGKSSSVSDCTDRDTESQPPKNGLEDEAASAAKEQSSSGDSLSPVGLMSYGVSTSEKKSPHKESTEHQFSHLHQHQVKGLGSTDSRSGRSHVHIKAVQSSHHKTLGHASEEKCVQERPDHQNKGQHQSTEDFSRAYIGSCPAVTETTLSNQHQTGDSSSVHDTSLSDSCGTQKSSHTERKSVNGKWKATDFPVHASCKKRNLSQGVPSARPYCEGGSQVTGTGDRKNCSGAKDTEVQSQVENGSDGMTDCVGNRKPVLSSSQAVNQHDKRNGDTKHSKVPREKILKVPSAKCSVDFRDSYGSLNRDKQKWNLHKSEQHVRRNKEQNGQKRENMSDSRHSEKSRKVKQTSAVCAFAEGNCNAEQNATSDIIPKPEYSVRASLNKDEEEKKSSRISSGRSNVTTLKSESRLSMCKESTKSTSLDQVVAKTDKAKKIVDSLRKIVKFVDWGSRKDGLHVKDVFSTNLARTQKLTSDVLDPGSKVDHAEMNTNETTTNKADSSRNGYIIKEHAANFRDSHKCESKSADQSSESMSLSSSLHQVSDGRKRQAEDNHRDTAPAISGHGSSNRCKSDDTDVVFCSKCMTVFIERGIYEKHGCCKHVETEDSDGEEANIEGVEDIAGKKSVQDAVGKRVKRGGEFVDRDGTKKRKRREGSTDSDSGLSDIHDMECDPDKGSVRCDLKTKAKAPKPIKKKKRRRILQGSEKRRKLEKLARSDWTKKPNNDWTKKPNNDKVQTMFNCELCDQVFLSRGGLLFHWQTVHMKNTN